MPEAKEIVKAIRDLTRELRAIRKVLESWDEDPQKKNKTTVDVDVITKELTDNLKKVVEVSSEAI